MVWTHSWKDCLFTYQRFFDVTWDAYGHSSYRTGLLKRNVIQTVNGEMRLQYLRWTSSESQNEKYLIRCITNTHENHMGEPKPLLCTLWNWARQLTLWQNTIVALDLFSENSSSVCNFSVLFRKGLWMIFKNMARNTAITILDVKNNCINRDTVIW